MELMTLGRPTKFEQAYVAQAEKLCRLGATDVQLADFFEVHVDTIYEWKKQHPDFLEATKAGKAQADQMVEQALFQRAIGYSHKETKLFCHEGAIVAEDIVKHHPPETTACIFWLKNRKPDQWRDKQVTELETARPIVLSYSLPEERPAQLVPVLIDVKEAS